jgi:nitrite reductase/ring-hydroxylating ferredoxin subunit
MIGNVVQCPWHGSQFDCRTGKVTAGPAKEPIAIYPVEEEDDRITLSVPEV